MLSNVAPVTTLSLPDTILPVKSEGHFIEKPHTDLPVRIKIPPTTQQNATQIPSSNPPIGYSDLPIRRRLSLSVYTPPNFLIKCRNFSKRCRTTSLVLAASTTHSTCVFHQIDLLNPDIHSPCVRHPPSELL